MLARITERTTRYFWVLSPYFETVIAALGLSLFSSIVFGMAAAASFLIIPIAECRSSHMRVSFSQ